MGLMMLEQKKASISVYLSNRRVAHHQATLYRYLDGEEQCSGLSDCTEQNKAILANAIRSVEDGKEESPNW